MTTTTETDTRTVETRYVHGQHYPTVNVKVRRYFDDVIRDARADKGYLDLDPRDGDRFLDWLEAVIEKGDHYERFGWAEEAASHDGFEDAREYAQDLFDTGAIRIWQDGRSGGWLYVDNGLPSVDDWVTLDAIPCVSTFADDGSLWAPTICGLDAPKHRGETSPRFYDETTVPDGCTGYTPDPDLLDLREKWFKFAAFCEARAQDCVDEAVSMIYLNVWCIDLDPRPADEPVPFWAPARSGHWV